VISRLSKRAVLRVGYGAVIAMLVFSAAEAYRIQISVSEQHLDMYRRYAEEEAALSTLRRNLWLAGNDVRDFFIRTSPEQAALLRSQLSQLERDDNRALRRLASVPGWKETARWLTARLDKFWAGVDPLPSTMLRAPSSQRLNFLQTVVVPQREELYTQLTNLAGMGQQRLEARERGFAETRRRAAEGLFLMLALGVLLSALVALLSVRHAEHLEREAERHYGEVERTKRELQQLSARLLEVEEEGRRKLSRELHDEIGQTLALLQIELSRTHYERARELAESAVQTVRNMAVLLRPALLDDLGLVPALQFLLEDFLRRSGIVCEFVERGVEDHLPDAVKTCVFRVVQEALHNCEKHAGASKVRVTVQQFPGLLAAEIEDNGRGFPADRQAAPSRAAGLGLLGMRERAGNAGGSLTVDSAPGQGTRIVLRIPLRQEVAASNAPVGEVVV
jgi:signal transduction histidine kinase